jgi:hypothetical protein
MIYISLYCKTIIIIPFFSNLEDGDVGLMIEYMDGGSLQGVVDCGGCRDESKLASIAYQVDDYFN